MQSTPNFLYCVVKTQKLRIFIDASESKLNGVIWGLSTSQSYILKNFETLQYDWHATEPTHCDVIALNKTSGVIDTAESDSGGPLAPSRLTLRCR
jgi:hypothetical protein